MPQIGTRHIAGLIQNVRTELKMAQVVRRYAQKSLSTDHLLDNLVEEDAYCGKETVFV